MSFKGTPYYDMALDADATKGDEAEQMAQMIYETQRQQEMDNYQESCTCPPAVGYGVDIPGLGCEVCPYCAEKLEDQDIPF